MRRYIVGTKLTCRTNCVGGRFLVFQACSAVVVALHLAPCVVRELTQCELAVDLRRVFLDYWL